MSIRMKKWRNLTSLLLCVGLGLSACSSGGDGNGGNGGTPAATVSGTATSPGGQLAKVAPTKLQQFFAALLPSDAWAQVIGGFAPVPNANVFLVRITNAGVPTGVPLILAQTTTNAAGQYTLTLPPGVTLASDLIVQVTNAAAPQPIPTAGTQNAPATQATVNVDPISEEVLREVIAFLGANPGNTLANFSAFELSELQRVINAAVAASPSLVGATAAQTIANIQANLAPALATTIPVLASSTNFLTVLSTSLPNGQANVAYSQPILAIGNPGALSYAVTVGNLPTGLSINPTTPQIAGTPTVAGTFNFSVQVSLPASPPSPVIRAFTLTIIPPPPPPVGLERVSVSTGGGEGNGASSAFTGFDRVSISRDGNVVAFSSQATSLVAGDTNAQPDIFVRDRLGIGTTTRVSVSSTGVQGASDSIRPMISGNGRYVVFSSKANLDLFDTSATNGYDIYRHDRTTGDTRLVNTFGVGQQFGGYTAPPFPATNDGGNLVLWSDGIFEVFVFDLAPGAADPFGAVVPNDINPPPANPFLLNPVTSDNGRYVAFVTNRAYVAADTNGFPDLYLVDRGSPVTGILTVTRLTNASSATAVGLAASMSADGNLIAFSSRDAEAVGDTNGLDDIYIYDRTAGTKTQVSVGVGGTNPNGASGAPAISADGRFVAFESTATNVVANDTNNRADIYVYDRNAGTTRRVSVNTTLVLGGGLRPWLTGNGSLTTFTSTASDLVLNDTNGVSDVFVAP